MILKSAFAPNLYITLSISISHFLKCKGELNGEMLNVYFAQGLIMLSVSPNPPESHQILTALQP